MLDGIRETVTQYVADKSTGLISYALAVANKRLDPSSLMALRQRAEALLDYLENGTPPPTLVAGAENSPGGVDDGSGLPSTEVVPAQLPLFDETGVSTEATPNFADATTEEVPATLQAVGGYDLDGTCLRDASRAFLKYMWNKHKVELAKIFWKAGLLDCLVGIPLMLFRFDKVNKMGVSEGYAFIGRIVKGFEISRWSYEWAPHGAKDFFPFIIRAWQADREAGRPIVIISSQAQITLAALLQQAGFDDIVIFEGDKTGATKVFEAARPRIILTPRITNPPKVYILGSLFTLDEEGRVTGLLEWNHKETKVKAIERFEVWLRTQGIGIDRDNTTAFYDKPYDVSWGLSLAPHARNRTVMNPHGLGAKEFTADSLGMGSRVVHIKPKTGVDIVRRGDKVFHVNAQGVETDVTHRPRRGFWSRFGRGSSDSNTMAGLFVATSIGAGYQTDHHVPHIHHPNSHNHHHHLVHVPYTPHSHDVADDLILTGTTAWGEVGAETFLGV